MSVHLPKATQEDLNRCSFLFAGILGLNAGDNIPLIVGEFSGKPCLLVSGSSEDEISRRIDVIQEGRSRLSHYTFDCFAPLRDVPLKSAISAARNDCVFS